MAHPRLIAAGVAALIGLLIGSGGDLAEAAYEVGPVPDWVVPRAADPALVLPQSRPDEAGLLLLDVQVDARGDPVERFQHIAIRLGDESSLESGSQFSVIYDPSYESLVIHDIRIHRAGVPLDRLDRERIQVLQRETQLEYRILDGRLTVFLPLEDIRKGDVLEYRFTIRGWNPVHEGKFFWFIPAEYEGPCGPTYYRFLTRHERPLHRRQHGSVTDPEILDHGDTVEYIWDLPERVGTPQDPQLPVWYFAYAWAQVSEFRDWEELVGWGLRLFDVTAPLSPTLRDAVADIRTNYESPQERATAALRYVQEKIRYLGIEFGESSHRPSPPAEVIDRRFGDCKDKALLLVVMLRELGLEAHPALVNTVYGEHLLDFHPSPQVFDHVIVKLIADGRTYWVDPTNPPQRGRLENLAPVTYGVALTLAPGQTEPEAMPAPEAVEPTRQVTMRFSLSESGPSELLVITESRRWGAEMARYRHRNTSAEEIRRDYTSFYATLYPTIESLGPVEIRDNEAENIFIEEERYRIPEFYEEEYESGGRIAKFFPLELEALIGDPPPGQRTMPAGISYPTHDRVVVELVNPERWRVEPERHNIETPAASFEFTVSAEDERLTLDWIYRTTADHVQPEDWADHVRGVRRMRDLLTYVVIPGSGNIAEPWWSPRELNWILGIVSILVLILSTILGIAALRWRRGEPPPETAADLDGPRGVGGWFLLPLLGVFLSPFVIAFNLLAIMPAITMSTWRVITNPHMPGFDPVLPVLVVAEMVGNEVVLVFSIVLMFALARRLRIFRRLYIVTMLAVLGLAWVDAVAVTVVTASGSEDIAEVGRLIMSSISTLLWCLYMLVSRRVRNTFIN